jgi:hypothetical protein
MRAKMLAKLELKETQQNLKNLKLKNKTIKWQGGKGQRCK